MVPDERTCPFLKAAAKLFEPFTDRAWTRDLPRDVRRAIVNLGDSSFAGWGHGEPLVSLESLGIERQTSDVLAIGEQTRLHGTASCKAFAMETRYGTLNVPLEKIAAIAGQRRTHDAAALAVALRLFAIEAVRHVDVTMLGQRGCSQRDQWYALVGGAE